MYAISVIFDIDPAHVEDFAEAAITHARNSKENESGCLAFDVFQDPDQPARFYFHECYVDKNAVEDVHNNAPYMALFGQKTAAWIMGKQINFWKSAQ